MALNLSVRMQTFERTLFYFPMKQVKPSNYAIEKRSMLQISKFIVSLFEKVKCQAVVPICISSCSLLVRKAVMSEHVTNN